MEALVIFQMPELPLTCRAIVLLKRPVGWRGDDEVNRLSKLMHLSSVAQKQTVQRPLGICGGEPGSFELAFDGGFRFRRLGQAGS
jgi:hypothetical protein